jgi:ParB family chromosome partitioning protein
MTKPHENRRALGKGLSALLPSRHGTATQAPPAPASASEPTPPSMGAFSIPIAKIDANPQQPRSVFEAERLQQLAQSIQENGIIQPLIVRRKADRFELVAGERRWRAAKIAGLADVPVILQDVADDRILELALIENIQREDLNPLEIAHAFDRLCRELNLSHEQIAQRTGKDRTTITNTLRLLKLPGDVQVLVAEHRLSMGHARALLGLPTPELQRELAESASAQGMSVRQVERMVQRMTEPREAKSAEEAKKQDPNVKWATQELERVLGTRIRIVEKSDQRGRIEIEYYSSEDLDRIYSLIVKEAADS